MSNVNQFHFDNAVVNDYTLVRKLLSQKTSNFVGPPKRRDHDALFFFELYSTHRIVVRKNPEDSDIICYADFKHFPKILPLSYDAWPKWIAHHYCLQLPMSKVNTLFLTYCVFNYTLNPDLLINLLREVFFRERKLRYIVILEMPRMEAKFKEDEPNYEDFKSFSKIYYPKVFSVGTCKNTQKLYIVHRDNIIIKMRYRKALPEDNDEVVDVIDIDIPTLKLQYGEYYIAEEIMTNDPYKTFIITEINHVTVGFFWLNKDVDIRKLISNYDLESFGNLLNVSCQERSKKLIMHVTDVHRRDKTRLFRCEDIDLLFEERKSLPLQFDLDKDDWSSYASLDTISENAPIDPSKNNFVQFCWLPECFWRLQKLIDELKKPKHYYNNTSRLMRVYYSSDVATQSNAFAMQLVGLHTSCDHREMFRFLIAAFSVHSDRDYCIFSLPVNWAMTTTLQELLHYFIPVLPRPGCEMDDLLYITHRSCLYGDITVSRLTIDDVEPINGLMNSKIKEVHPLSSEASVQTDCPYDSDEETAFKKEQTEMQLISDIMEDVLNNPHTQYKFVTIRVGNSAAPDAGNVVVGFVILRKFDFIHFLHEQFRIAPTHQLVKAMRYEIVGARLHPLFLFESDMIFREISRVCTILQILYLSPKTNKCLLLPNDLLPRMQPIQPKLIAKLIRDRKNIVQYVPPDPEEPEINTISKFDYSKEYFSLYLNNLRATKIFGSRRSIVIIGFNDVTKAFLRLKLFEWNKKDFENSQRYICIPQHNITVIANPGVVEGEVDIDFQCTHCLDQADCWLNWWNSDAFIRDAVLRMDLQKYFKFVSGKVERIDRSGKYVVLDNECNIFYEDLIIVCDTKFGIPKPNFTLDIWPSNYQHINNRFDKIMIYHKLNIMINGECCDENPIKILVYGKHLQAFEFINFLIKHGVPGYNITMVFNIDKLDESDVLVSNPRHDYRIELILQEMVEDMGVKVYEYCKFSHWIMHEGETNIKSAVFEQPFKNENLIIDCDLFVSYMDVRMGHTMLKLLEDNDFQVENGKILVDYAFRTNDPNIYAVGSCITYGFETNLQLQNVSAKEMATKLIQSLNTNPQNESVFDTKYKEVSYCGLCLPFGYRMAKVVSPRRSVADLLNNEYSTSLVTYHDYEFCRVRLNRNNMVEEIVVVTQKTMCLDFLKHFCGKHELLLNNLHAHWFIRSFDSFLDFFQEPWSELVQHDNFERLSKQNKELALVAAQQLLHNREDISQKHRRELLIKTLKEGGISGNVEENVLNFLRKYRYEMTEKFALPEDFPKAPDI